jgi:hypothetical protein
MLTRTMEIRRANANVRLVLASNVGQNLPNLPWGVQRGNSCDRITKAPAPYHPVFALDCGMFLIVERPAGCAEGFAALALVLRTAFVTERGRSFPFAFEQQGYSFFQRYPLQPMQTHLLPGKDLT